MNYNIRIEVSEEKLNKLLDELNNALETIRWCYSKLKDLGVVTITEGATSRTDDPSKKS